MSQHRRAYTQHQRQFFNNHVHKNFKHKSPLRNKKLIPLPRNFDNSKIAHANHTGSHIFFKLQKQCYSKRLGIKYRITYKANGKRYFTLNDKNRCYIYRKKLDKFTLTLSNNVKTSRWQQKCFNHACNRGFNSYQHMKDSRTYLQSTAHQHLIPIQHLKYLPNKLRPHQCDYKFDLPSTSFSITDPEDKAFYYKEPITSSQSLDAFKATTSTKPSMDFYTRNFDLIKLPKVLEPFIPEKPVQIRLPNIGLVTL
ncbi:hypothetical protein C1646_766868 [Rhizophagus diaphanus]|nr:hypothetical protein C1646_766868 [Rhizophagus diaphanus] [Rhizophagus sp. MUCL 43196]